MTPEQIKQICKDYLQGNLNIEVSVDSSYERESGYIGVTVTLYLDNEAISRSYASAPLPR